MVIQIIVQSIQLSSIIYILVHSTGLHPLVPDRAQFHLQVALPVLKLVMALSYVDQANSYLFRCLSKEYFIKFSSICLKLFKKSKYS
jgi:hypothetical protein